MFYGFFKKLINFIFFHLNPPWFQPRKTTDLKITLMAYFQVPNGLGTLSALVQLLLYATFYKSTQRQIAERKAQIHLSEVVVNGAPSLPEKTANGGASTTPTSDTTATRKA